MRPDTTPSSYPGNDWSRYSLDQIWRMLSGHSARGGQVAADMWARMRRLCDGEADRIEAALQQLAQHWPPTQEAARMFQDWGARLVYAMRRTARVAEVNGPVIESISAEFAAARSRVADLVAERDAYQAAVAARPMTRGLGAQQARLRSYTIQAREVMADLEVKVARYADGIRWDPIYEPLLNSSTEQHPSEEQGAVRIGGGWSPGAWAMSMPSPDPEWPPDWSAPPAGDDPPLGDSSQGLPGGGSPVPPGETVLDGELPVGAPIAGSGGSWPGGPFIDTPSGRVLAPGGVILAPGTGGVAATPGGSGGTAVASPAPGSVPAAGRPGGPGVPFLPPMVMGQPGGQGPGRGRATSRRARPGTPGVFEVPDGPPAVIRAPEEPASHDPGPGVIGIDR